VHGGGEEENAGLHQGKEGGGKSTCGAQSKTGGRAPSVERAQDLDLYFRGGILLLGFLSGWGGERNGTAKRVQSHDKEKRDVREGKGQSRSAREGGGFLKRLHSLLKDWSQGGRGEKKKNSKNLSQIGTRKGRERNLRRGDSYIIF